MTAVKGSNAGVEALMTLPLVKRLEPSTILASLPLIRRCITGGAGGSMFTGVGALTNITSLSSKSMLIALSKVANFGVCGAFESLAEGDGMLGMAPLGVSSILLLIGVKSPRPKREAVPSAGVAFGEMGSGSIRCR